MSNVEQNFQITALVNKVVKIFKPSSKRMIMNLPTIYLSIQTLKEKCSQFTSLNLHFSRLFDLRDRYSRESTLFVHRLFTFNNARFI